MLEHTIVVEFEAAADAGDRLVSVLEEHARRTLEEEPGCLRFDVLEPLDEAGHPVPGRVVVCETYRDSMALEAHRANPRMERVFAALSALTVSRRRLLARSLAPRPAEEGIRPEHLSAANDD